MGFLTEFKMGGTGPDEEPRYVRLLLRVTRLFRGVYQRLGVEYDSLAELLRVKLLLDHRRPQQASPGAWKRPGVALLYFGYCLFGLLLGAAVFFVGNPLHWMTLVMSSTLMMLALPLLVDFPAILLDTADVALLSPLPIPDRTLLALRVTHMSLFMGSLVMALAIGPLCFGVFVYDPWLFVPILSLGLAQTSALALASVLLLYLLALRTLDLSRFRDAMVWLQMASIALFFLGSQVLPRLVEWLGVYEFLEAHPEVLAVVPVSASGAVLRMGLGLGDSTDALGAAWGLGITLLLAGACALLARKGFLMKLAEMEIAGGAVRAKAARHGITGRLGGICSRSRAERAGWAFVTQLTRAERTFKLRALPPYGMVLAFAIAPALASVGGHLPFGQFLVPLAPYVLLPALVGSWSETRNGESWRASWALGVLDGAEREAFVRGGIRATWVRFHAIPCVLLAVVLVPCVGRSGLLDLTIATGLTLSAGAWLLPVVPMFLPFSRELTPRNTFDGATEGVVALGVALALAAAHAGLTFAPYAVPAIAPIVPAVLYHAWRRLGHVQLREQRRYGSRDSVDSTGAA